MFLQFRVMLLCHVHTESERERELLQEVVPGYTPGFWKWPSPLCPLSPSLPAAPSLAVFPNQPPSCPSTWTPGVVEEEGGMFGCDTDREVLLAPKGLGSGTLTIL